MALITKIHIILKEEFIPILVLLILLATLNLHSQELIPLKVNNNWKYIETVTINDKIVETDTLNSSIKSKLILNGKEWFLMEELGDEFIVRDDKEGQYEIDTLTTLKNGNFKEILMFKRPTRNTSISYHAFDDLTITIAPNTILIKTEAGDFNCIKYTIDYKEENEFIEFYIKPDIGVICHRRVENDTITTVKLLEYNLK